MGKTETLRGRKFVTFLCFVLRDFRHEAVVCTPLSALPFFTLASDILWDNNNNSAPMNYNLLQNGTWPERTTAKIYK